MKKSVRFTSEKSAKNFSRQTGGELRDLRNYDNRRSDFRVVVDREGQDRNESDFDSDINLNGTDWHTADDL